MAPIRRYLRITKYSVLEVRIYLDNPALAASWLLNPRSPVLPRVIEAVRPLVLPKLREEGQRRKARPKAKGVKDVVVEDDFEVSVFLTETSSRHAILTKQKAFKPKSSRGRSVDIDALTGNDPADGQSHATAVQIPDESDDDAPVRLADIPTASASGKRRHSLLDSDDGADGLFVSDGDGEDDADALRAAKRVRDGERDDAEPEGGADEKKKMGMDTTYDGFSIYGKALCLVVKRRGGGRGQGLEGSSNGQAMMENWIAATQAPPEEVA